MSQDVKTDVLKATGIVAGSAVMSFAAGKTAQKTAMNRTAGERAAINAEIQKLLEENQSLETKFPSLLERYKSMKTPEAPIWENKDTYEAFAPAIPGEQDCINAGYERANKLKQDFCKGLKGKQYKELQSAMKNKADINALSPEIRDRYEAYLKYQKARESVNQYEQARLDVINCNKTVSNNMNRIKQLKDKLSGITKQCSNKGFKVGACVALAVGSIAALCLFSGSSRETA